MVCFSEDVTDRLSLPIWSRYQYYLRACADALCCEYCSYLLALAFLRVKNVISVNPLYMNVCHVAEALAGAEKQHQTEGSL